MLKASFTGSLITNCQVGSFSKCSTFSLEILNDTVVVYLIYEHEKFNLLPLFKLVGTNTVQRKISKSETKSDGELLK